MSNVYNPARGFFIGKASKYVKIAVLVGLLAYPATIQAATVKGPVQTTLTIAEATSGMAQDAFPVLNTTKTTQNTASAAPSPSILSLANSQMAYITAYTSDPDETSDHPLITASGHMVADGIVADNNLPFGTRIEIPSLFGNKIFIVEDRTADRFSGRVDIWMPNVTKAINFGIQHVAIVVLDSDVALK